MKRITGARNLADLAAATVFVISVATRCGVDGATEPNSETLDSTSSSVHPVLTKMVSTAVQRARAKLREAKRHLLHDKSAEARKKVRDAKRILEATEDRATQGIAVRNIDSALKRLKAVKRDCLSAPSELKAHLTEVASKYRELKQLVLRSRPSDPEWQHAVGEVTEEWGARFEALAYDSALSSNFRGLAKNLDILGRESKVAKANGSAAARIDELSLAMGPLARALASRKATTCDTQATAAITAFAQTNGVLIRRVRDDVAKLPSSLTPRLTKERLYQLISLTVSATPARASRVFVPDVCATVVPQPAVIRTCVSFVHWRDDPYAADLLSPWEVLEVMWEFKSAIEEMSYGAATLDIEIRQSWPDVSRPTEGGEVLRLFRELFGDTSDCHWLIDYPKSDSTARGGGGVARIGPYSFNLATLIHENGHSMGYALGSGRSLNHAHDLDAADSVLFPGALEKSDYGDHYDPMGTGTMHFNAFHKEKVGWIRPMEVEWGPGAIGRYVIAAMEAPSCGHPHALKIPLPVDLTDNQFLDLCTARTSFSSNPPCPTPGTWRRTHNLAEFLYIEYRRPIGLDEDRLLGFADRGLATAAGGGVIHTATSESGGHSFLLDCTPGSRTWSGGRNDFMDALSPAGTCCNIPYLGYNICFAATDNPNLFGVTISSAFSGF
ncbi:MAG: hypothetical protein HYY84_04545 [Deltaproteobacteria bacterium]|nr:hypothetical protein [Deltaproteobacteria bacterium]